MATKVRAATKMNSQFRPMVTTSGRDCGVATTEELIRFGTRGKIKLGPGKTRNRMKNRKDWTNPLDAERAVNSIDKEARRRGMKPLRYKRAGNWTKSGLISSGATKQSLVDRAKRGELIQLVVDYGKVNAKYPHLSGSKSFDDLHSIWVGGRAAKGKPGIRTRKGQLELLYADPTWNRPGTPKGVRWVPLSTIWDISNGVWSSKGGTGWVGGSVAQSALLKPTDPPEPPDPKDPVDKCEDEIADLEAERDEAVAALTEAMAQIEAMREQQITQELADRLKAIADEIDDLVPDVMGVKDTDILEGVKIPEK